MNTCYIWGTGKLAETFYQVMGSFFDVIGFIESRPSKESFFCMPVISPHLVKLSNVEQILVVNNHFDEISASLKDTLVLDKIVDVFRSKAYVSFDDGAMRINYISKNNDYSSKENVYWLTWDHGLLNSNSQLVIDTILDKASDISKRDYWNSVGSNVALQASRELKQRQMKFLKDNLIPRLSKSSIILDIGCSDGFF